MCKIFFYVSPCRIVFHIKNPSVTFKLCTPTIVLLWFYFPRSHAALRQADQDEQK